MHVEDDRVARFYIAHHRTEIRLPPQAQVFGGLSVTHYSLRHRIKLTDDRAQQLSCHLRVSYRY